MAGVTRRNLRLQKDPGRVRISGGEFEFKMVALMHARLRTIQRRRPKLLLRYYIASNVLGMNPFDDIVLFLRWRENQQENSLVYCMQLKYAENTKHYKVNTNNLQDFLNLYKKLKFHGEQNAAHLNINMQMLQKYHINDFRFIFFTTMIVNAVNPSKTSSSLPFPFEDCLQTGNGTVFSFSQHDGDVWRAFEGNNDEYIFRTEFLPRLRIFCTQKHPSLLDREIIRAVEEATEGILPRPKLFLLSFLYNVCKWWDRNKVDCLCEQSAVLEEIVMEDLSSIPKPRQLQFKAQYVDILISQLKDFDAAYIMVPGIPAELRCSKLYQFLEVMYPNQFLILTETLWKEYSPAVLKAVCSTVCKILVINSEVINDAAYSIMETILNEKLCKLVVISSSSNCDLYNFLTTRARSTCWTERWSIEQLMECEQHQLLLTPVSFQGYQMALKELETVWPNLRSDIGADSLATLILGEQLVLGAPLSTLYPFYLQRKIQDDHLTTKHTVNSKMKLIVGNPGIGKSTYLNYLAHSYKKENPAQWVVLLILGQGTLMDDVSDLLHEEYVIDLLCRATIPEKYASFSAARQFMRISLKESGNLVLLVDSVDEICPSRKTKVLNMLQLIQRDLKFQQLWIATRPIVEQDITRVFHSTPVTLDPFSKEQQHEYLMMYWGKHFKMNDEKLHEYIKEFLFIIKQTRRRYINLATPEKDLLQVPFFLGIVAEAYETSAINGELPYGVSLTELSLINLFVEYLRKTYWTKCEVSLDKIKDQGWARASERDFLKYHTTCAAYLQFDCNLLGKFKDEVCCTVEDILLSVEEEKTGIMIKIVDGKPQFTHRVFVEYFSALWLLDKFQYVPDLVETFYTQASESNEYVLYYFQALLAEGHALHEAVLSDSLSIVEEELNVDEEDRGGRTALHYAAMRSSRKIIDMLLEKEPDVNVCDNVLGWPPLVYAITNIVHNLYFISDLKHEVYVVELLLRKGADPVRPRSVKKFSNNLLQTALKNDFHLFVKMIISNDEECISTDTTLLSFASRRGNLKSVKILVDAGVHFDTANRFGVSSVFLAAFYGYTEICALLLNCEENTEKRDLLVRDVCTFASLWGQKRTSFLLLETFLKNHDFTVKESILSEPCRDQATPLSHRLWRYTYQIDRSVTYEEYLLTVVGILHVRLQAERCRRPGLQLRYNLITEVKDMDPFDSIILFLRWIEGKEERNTVYCVKLWSCYGKESIHKHVDLYKRLGRKENFKTNDFDENMRKISQLPIENFRFIILSKMKYIQIGGCAVVGNKSAELNSSLDYPFEDIFCMNGYDSTKDFLRLSESTWDIFKDDDEKMEFQTKILPRVKIFSVRGLSHFHNTYPSLMERALRDSLGPEPVNMHLAHHYYNYLRLWRDSSQVCYLTEQSTILDNTLRDDINDQIQCQTLSALYAQALQSRLQSSKNTYIVIPNILPMQRCSIVKGILGKLYPGRFLMLTDTVFKTYSQCSIRSVVYSICEDVTFSIDSMDDNVFSLLQDILSHNGRVRILCSMWNKKLFDLVSSKTEEICAWTEWFASEHKEPQRFHDTIQPFQLVPMKDRCDARTDLHLELISLPGNKCFSEVQCRFKMAGLVCARLEAMRRRRPELHLHYELGTSNINKSTPMVLLLQWRDEEEIRNLVYYVFFEQRKGVFDLPLPEYCEAEMLNMLWLFFRDPSPLLTHLSDFETKLKNILSEKHDVKLLFFTVENRCSKHTESCSDFEFPFEEIFWTGQGEILSCKESAAARDMDETFTTFLPSVHVFSGQAVSALESLVAEALEDALGAPLLRRELFLSQYLGMFRTWWWETQWEDDKENALNKTASTSQL